ncbi:lasso peptide biosynthesis B2 protein [Qipengyuania sp.]|uniref:lasso peptide biosynthesis B2 protein n=1 Tax=Qipengyuania sp. TaxID=2004515 RepID=UPI0037370F3B
MRKLRTALSLPATDLALTGQAALLLIGYATLIRLFPPRHWRHRTPRIAPARPARGDEPFRVRRALGRALRNLPFAPNCLPQALAARHLLHRRGVAYALHVGACRDEAGAPRFHAWTIAGGLWVTGESDDGLFVPFALAASTAPAPPCEPPARLASPPAQ